jgi:hypothetical protein
MVAPAAVAEPKSVDRRVEIHESEGNFQRWLGCANGGQGELLVGTTVERLVAQNFTNEAGNHQWNWQISYRGEAVGQTTGDVYRIKTHENENYHYFFADDVWHFMVNSTRVYQKAGPDPVRFMDRGLYIADRYGPGDVEVRVDRREITCMN